MTAKAKKAPHSPPHGTPKYDEWRKNIAVGMRRAKARRRKAGRLSLLQAAVEFCLPYSFVRRSVDLGKLQVIQAGNRRYVHRSEAKRVFGEVEL